MEHVDRTVINDQENGLRATSSGRVNLDELADRLREVRRLLSRGKPLAGVLDRFHPSDHALRAVTRLEHAVKRLDDPSAITRSHAGNAFSSADGDRLGPADMPWLVRVVERRADLLETILLSSAPAQAHGLA